MKNFLKELLIIILTYYEPHTYEGYVEAILLNIVNVNILINITNTTIKSLRNGVNLSKVYIHNNIILIFYQLNNKENTFVLLNTSNPV